MIKSSIKNLIVLTNEDALLMIQHLTKEKIVDWIQIGWNSDSQKKKKLYVIEFRKDKKRRKNSREVINLTPEVIRGNSWGECFWILISKLYKPKERVGMMDEILANVVFLRNKTWFNECSDLTV